ncbi:MAG: flagellar basal-body rod protein FlgC [Candidatus Saganbacteria bacterium]|uniref:Flagellar basal-body rod protein FlgC n=1 Tax=Candidatus Saganbacteria bacterium TaxID=2575572 RepID=A0A833L2Y3_UNCSA|nr:MAG: flagellar basal-body rod protein FlgC [Candidatus Saganbacteria bacterium]
MGFKKALEISVSGLMAEKKRLELISSNIANINTTRTLDGGAYRRKIAVFQENPLSFSEELAIAENNNVIGGGGVEVAEVVSDQSPYQKVYKPGHPDADSNGYVNMPNVDLSTEMVDMVAAGKFYDANITVYEATKKNIMNIIQLQ